MRPITVAKVANYAVHRKVMLNLVHLSPSDLDILQGVSEVGDCGVAERSGATLSIVKNGGMLTSGRPIWIYGKTLGLSDELVKALVDLFQNCDEVEFGEAYPAITFLPSYEKEWENVQ